MQKYGAAFLLAFIVSSCTSNGGQEQGSIAAASLAAKVFLSRKNQLGEGVIWDHRQLHLLWVDIVGKALQVYDPATKEIRLFNLGQRVGAVVPTPDGNAVVAMQNGIYRFDLETGDTTLIADPEKHLPGNRMNDGKCGPGGRLWVGSMHLEEKAGAASLYRIDPSGAAKQMLDGITISNGLAWSHDHQTMYYIDTPDSNVKAFDYDKATGDITNERIAITIPDSLGFPDGMTIDAEGMLWIALWAGEAVGRWNPDTGKLLAKIKVPAYNVTSCAFGGENLDTLFITSARIGMTDEQLEQFPQAGSVFAAVPGVKGVAPYYFGEVVEE